MEYVNRTLRGASAGVLVGEPPVIGLLSPAGVPGTAIYVAADGLNKASLFLCVGILQHRYSRVDEVRLRGFGRELPFTGLVFAAGGLAFAATPPFGTCSVGSEEWQIGGQAPERYTFRLDGRRLECGLHENGRGALKLMLTAGDDVVRSFQQSSAGESNVSLTYSDDGVSVAQSSSS